MRRIREVHVHEYGGGSMWLVEGTERCLLVETGPGVKSFRQFVDTVTKKPVIAFASLGYYTMLAVSTNSTSDGFIGPM